MFGIGVEVETGLNDEDGCPHLLRAFFRFLELSVRAITASQTDGMKSLLGYCRIHLGWNCSG